MAIKSEQEVLSPQDMARQRVIQESVDRWANNQKAQESGVRFLAPIAGILMFGSMISSVIGGPPNMATWFSAFCILTFIGGTIAGIAAVVTELTRRVSVKPSTARVNSYGDVTTE